MNASTPAVEARNLAPLPGDVDFTVGASLPISGLTAWQGLFEHGRLQAGRSVLVHGAAGAVGWDGTGAWRVTTDAPAGGFPVGSGDCFLAGLVGDLAADVPLRDALVTAASVGAANAAVPGGALFDDATLSHLRGRTRAVEL